MTEPKSHITSLGLDREGSCRGILLSSVVTDLALLYPKYRRVGLLAPGREWKVIGAVPGLNGSVTVLGGVQNRGNADDFVIVGDTLNLTRVKGTQVVAGEVTEPGEPFSSTPLTVTNIRVNSITPTGAHEITFTFSASKTVPSLALDGYDFLNCESCRPAPWQTWDIHSHTIGANANVVIDGTTGQLDSVSDAALCACDTFLCQDLVQISGRGDNGKNNGLFECRADKTDNPGTCTIHLDGHLQSITSGSLGTITLLLPTPLRVVGTARAVLRAHNISLAKGNVVRLRRSDEANDFWEIQHPADVGPPQWFNPVTP